MMPDPCTCILHVDGVLEVVKGCPVHNMPCGHRHGRAVCDRPKGHDGVHTGPVGNYEEYHSWPNVQPTPSTKVDECDACNDVIYPESDMINLCRRHYDALRLGQPCPRCAEFDAICESDAAAMDLMAKQEREGVFARESDPSTPTKGKRCPTGER